MNILVPSLTPATRTHVLAAFSIFFVHHRQRLVLPGHRHISLPSCQSTSPDTNTAKRPVTYVDFYICHICPARWPASVHMPAAPPGGLVCSCPPSWMDCSCGGTVVVCTCTHACCMRLMHLPRFPLVASGAYENLPIHSLPAQSLQRTPANIISRARSALHHPAP